MWIGFKSGLLSYSSYCMNMALEMWGLQVSAMQIIVGAQNENLWKVGST